MKKFKEVAILALGLMINQGFDLERNQKVDYQKLKDDVQKVTNLKVLKKEVIFKKPKLRLVVQNDEMVEKN